MLGSGLVILIYESFIVGNHLREGEREREREREHDCFVYCKTYILLLMRRRPPGLLKVKTDMNML